MDLLSRKKRPKTWTENFKGIVQYPRNAQGAVVRSGNLTGDEVVIETSELVSGLYRLHLIDETGATKVVTLVKE